MVRGSNRNCGLVSYWGGVSHRGNGWGSQVASAGGGYESRKSNYLQTQHPLNKRCHHLCEHKSTHELEHFDCWLMVFVLYDRMMIRGRMAWVYIVNLLECCPQELQPRSGSGARCNKVLHVSLSLDGCVAR